MSIPDHYDVKGVARVLGLSEPSVRRLIASGELAATRIGRNRRTLRVPARVLAEYLAAGAVRSRG